MFFDFSCSLFFQLAHNYVGVSFYCPVSKHITLDFQNTCYVNNVSLKHFAQNGVNCTIKALSPFLCLKNLLTLDMSDRRSRTERQRIVSPLPSFSKRQGVSTEVPDSFGRHEILPQYFQMKWVHILCLELGYQKYKRFYGTKAFYILVFGRFYPSWPSFRSWPRTTAQSTALFQHCT